MKICDLALFSPETSSGVKTYIASKIEYARTRPEVDHVVVVPGRTPSVSMQGRSKLVVVRGVRTFYPGIYVGLNLWTIAGIVERERPDIIELNCQYTLPWAAFLATRRLHTPIVGVYHTDVPACVRHMARGAGDTIASALERLVEWYEGLIYRHCTMTITLNPGMNDRMERLGVERLCCLPCGVDVTTFSPAKRDEAWRARLGIGPDSTVLMYAGRLSVEKELDVLFDAFDRLASQDFALVIAGDGPDAAAITRRAAAHPSITYLGHVESRAELATAYASSDIFLIPGRHETFGMATLEAISCGLPVVGIRQSGTARLVPPEIGLLAPAGDAQEFATAISTVAAWPLDDLRPTCHSFAAERYSWDSVLDRYFNLYRQVIDEGTEPPASV
jgi:alpha-1,6-mannosyltransferase